MMQLLHIHDVNQHSPKVLSWLVMVQATEEQRAVHETSLRLFEPCNMVHCPAEKNLSGKNYSVDMKE